MLSGGAARAGTRPGSTLQIALPPEPLQPAFDALDLALTPLPADGTGTFRLTVANATRGQTGYSFLPSYLGWRRSIKDQHRAGRSRPDCEGAPTEEPRLNFP